MMAEEITQGIGTYHQPMGALLATVYLAGRIRALTPRGAALFLELGRDGYDMMVSEGLNINFLYEEVFPQAYANSSRPLYSHEREFEFYHLIDKHKFTIDLSPLYHHPQYIYPYIPIQCIQRHDWITGNNLPFETWPVAYQLVIALCNTFLRKEWWTRFAQLYDLPVEPRPARYEGVSVEKFAEGCFRKEGLGLLPQAFLIVAYKTGNLFLDAHTLNPTFYVANTRYDWNKENIEILAGEWKKARRILKDILAISNYLRHRRDVIARAVEIWNQSAGEWEY